MTAPVLVTGGTGTLGQHLVPILSDAGRDVRVLSRHPHEPADRVDYVIGDLLAEEGIEAAVDDIEVIVHCAGNAKGDDEATRNLVQAAARGRVQHLVYISVIGADRIPVVSRTDRMMFGYFASKAAAEQIITDSGLPWTTLRAAQFHDLQLKAVTAMAKMPVIPVPSGFRFQPIDAGEVATRLGALALDSPAGLVPEIAGPSVYTMTELVRSYLQARHKHRPLVPVHVPGGAARAIRAGANLAPDRAVGHRTWEAFLADRVRADS